jgi:hypothetical protein
MKKTSGPNNIKLGQPVKIKYDKKFREIYPHTYALFDGKKGIAKDFDHHSGISMIQIELTEFGRPALVDACYVFPD